VNAEAGLGSTDADVLDKAIEVCPVGAILKKRQGYTTPIGQRPYDDAPIGSDIENSA
jgi:[NiFe] hydrogenase diaphorase moiety small subunit